MMSVLLIIDVIALALLAWFSLFKIVPDCATSRFRYRLWRLRDDLVDELRRDAFRDPERARRFVWFIEGFIEEADDLSALNWVWWSTATRGYKCDDYPLDLESLQTEDAARLQRYRDELVWAIFLKVMAGTPSGWIGAVIGIPILLAGELVRRFKGRNASGSVLDHARQQVVEDFDLNAGLLALMRSGSRRSRGPLYHHK